MYKPLGHLHRAAITFSTCSLRASTPSHIASLPSASRRTYTQLAQPRYRINSQLRCNNNVYNYSCVSPFNNVVKLNAVQRGMVSGGQVKTSSEGGPVSWISMLVVLLAGSGVVYYFREEKRKVKEAVTHKAKPIGMPRIGGSFELVDSATGKLVTESDFRGKWMILYFGFTFCPDVCPDELYKIADICNYLEGTKLVGENAVPVFVSIDPKRDTAEVVKEYVKEFHPRMVGLTGTNEQCQGIAKAYRVHTSQGPPMDDDPNDYIVDHSIITYLVDPQGVFQAFYGQNRTVNEVAEDIIKYVRNWSPRTDEQLAKGV